MFFTPKRKDYDYEPMYRMGPARSTEAELLDKLRKKVEALTSATVEYTSLELELVDKKQVIKLIEDMKEDL